MINHMKHLINNVYIIMQFDFYNANVTSTTTFTFYYKSSF
ncbi:hypothetical protein BMB171_C0075 [Bacillus thuringiensis BMB171]|nr:hypothetical protein BMB171_C0075 [Bacillus thuringiensis BMB171]